MTGIIVWLLIGLHPGGSAPTVSALYDQIECRRLGEKLVQDHWLEKFDCYSYEIRGIE